MLPKVRRLTSKDVTEVMRRGRSRRGVYLSLKRLTLPSPLRTSAVVAKSVAKKAVERNRLRRAVYRALGGIATPLTTGDVVVFVQKVPKNDIGRVFKDDLIQLFTTTH